MAQAVGFTLRQIKPALPFVSGPKPNCPYLQEALNQQIDTVNSKIDSLKSAKQKLIEWKEKNKALMS